MRTIPAGALHAPPQPPVIGRQRQAGRRMPRQPSRPYHYGEGFACRDMADGALVIVIEGMRGGRAPAWPYTHRATGAFARTTVTVGWDTANRNSTLPASTR